MAKRASINSRAKKAEREVQQYLWPGSRFAGNAHRPALEDEDLWGFSVDMREWWGEVKSYGRDTIHGAGGPWLVLANAWHQCLTAIARAEGAGMFTATRPEPFAVLRVTHTAIDSPQNLAMVLVGSWPDGSGRLCIIPLYDFREHYIGRRGEGVA